MFTSITALHYMGTQGHEHLWTSKEQEITLSFTATLLGQSIIRVRCLRTEQVDTARYSLVDGATGTLPYHSWIVATGDEQWEQNIDDSDTRTHLESYLHGFSFSDDALRLARPLAPQEYIYGLGEHTDLLNLRGRTFPIWTYDPPKGHGAHTVAMYAAIPFSLHVDAATGTASGMLIDHTGRIEMDLGHQDAGKLQATLQGNDFTVYFIAGPKPADVLRNYTALTGRMHLPPSWSLGLQQARWSYATEQQVRDVATKLRERNHPSDGVWLDIDYLRGYRPFTWNHEAFPDPSKLIRDMGNQGFHIVPVIDPGFKTDAAYTPYQHIIEHDYMCRLPNGEAFVGSAWPGDCVFPDFSRDEVRKWWGELYQGFLQQGIAGSWNDMNEPSLTTMMQKHTTNISGASFSNDIIHRAGGEEATGPDGPPTTHLFFHNAYGLQMARAAREAAQSLFPDARPFVLTRAGTAGVQRYGAVWTGDNSSWWEHIRLGMVMCLNLSMSGVPVVGADIGGFWENCTGELLVRFAQMGALLPFCRNHNALHDREQEPWSFGEPYESAYRTAIEQRYRLLPYLYTLFHEAATTGEPILRPLYYYYAQDEQVYTSEVAETEFLVGRSLLSAPISQEGAINRQVYLPEGTWMSYWDGQMYLGGRWHSIGAPLEQWPLFVLAPSILPLGPIMQYVGQHATDPLTLHCYMIENGEASYTLYEDDGATLGYRNGAFAQTRITCSVDETQVKVSIEEDYSSYRPQREEYDVIVHTGTRVLHTHLKAGQGRVNHQW